MRVRKCDENVTLVGLLILLILKSVSRSQASGRHAMLQIALSAIIPQSFMDEIQKNRIKRFLSKFGFRLSRSNSNKFATDKENYPELANQSSKEKSRLTIFDIGANIGQSAHAFRSQFPEAAIYSFEPFRSSYAALQQNTRALSVSCHQLALGAEARQTRVRLVSRSAAFTENSLLHLPTEETPEEMTESIDVVTVDAFCRANSILKIDILKTDTEGYELEVLKGSRTLLQAGRITNVLCEATLNEHDPNHINFFKLVEFLAPYGLHPYSIYDVCHCSDGSVYYLNALFKLPR
jgi:FkbM family methyltransferase